MRRLILGAAALFALVLHPLRTLKSVIQGAREGWRRGVAGEPKEQMPSMRGHVVDVEIAPRKPSHRTYGFSHQIIEVGETSALAVRNEEGP